MRSASKECLQAMEDRRDFYSVAEIVFASGVKKILTRWDFVLSGNSVVEGAGSSALPLGVVVSKQITLSIRNDDDQWSEYDFFGAKIFLRTQFDLDDGKIESWNIGTFTVIAPETYGTTIDITAVDDCYKLDKDYSTNLPYPLTIGAAVRDSCSACGVQLLSTTFANDNFIIQQPPESLTHRQFIGMCAMIAGGNAKMDEYNRLKIMTYDFSEFEKPGLYGGVFDKISANVYQTGDAADGGSFNPWNTGYVMSGGEFGDRSGVHVLWQFKNGLKVDVDDVVITGVQLVDADENIYLAGTEGYVLPLENQLAAGKESEVAALIGAKVIGLKFRPFTGDHISYPLAEFMDIAYVVDWKQNVYQTVLTDVDFTYYGFTTLKCAADSPIRNSSKYYGNEVKAIVAARKMVQDEKTDREKAVENLADMLAKSSGLYITVDTQPDGSSIYYMHNKSTLAASDIVWKLTAEAFGISTDGGKTYPYGFTVTGEMITRLLYAEGIDADYINTGALKISDNSGNILFYADYDTKQVQIRGMVTFSDLSGSGKSVINGSNITTGTINCNLLNGGKINGQVFEGGTIHLYSDGSPVMDIANTTYNTEKIKLTDKSISGQALSVGKFNSRQLYEYFNLGFETFYSSASSSNFSTGKIVLKGESDVGSGFKETKITANEANFSGRLYEFNQPLDGKYATRDSCLLLTGGTMRGDAVFQNAKFLRGTDTDGNVCNLIGLNSGNNIHIGTHGDNDVTDAPVYLHGGGSQYNFLYQAFLPNANDKYSLGSETNKWADAYISGITSSQIFSNSIYSNYIYAYGDQTGYANLIKLNTSGNIHIGVETTDTNNETGVYVHAKGVQYDFVQGSFNPHTSNTKSLGESSKLWSTVYAKTGTINTSDRNKKRNIEDIPEKYMDLFYKLKPKIFMFDDGDRIHVGGISQDVEEAMEEIGLTPEEFGGFCKDIHYEYAEFDEDGNGIEESKRPALDDDGNIIYDYSMRYQEFIFLVIEATHRLKRESDQLKIELSDIKNKVGTICQAIGI